MLDTKVSQSLHPANFEIGEGSHHPHSAAQFVAIQPAAGVQVNSCMRTSTRCESYQTHGDNNSPQCASNATCRNVSFLKAVSFLPPPKGVPHKKFHNSTVPPLFSGKKKPRRERQGSSKRSLAVTYSHMGRPHTTIGDTPFHFWVRDGTRWFRCSLAARQKTEICLVLNERLNKGSGVIWSSRTSH